MTTLCVRNAKISSPVYGRNKLRTISRLKFSSAANRSMHFIPYLCYDEPVSARVFQPDQIVLHFVCVFHRFALRLSMITHVNTIVKFYTKTVHPCRSNRSSHSGRADNLFHRKSNFSRFVSPPRLAGRSTNRFARRSR